MCRWRQPPTTSSDDHDDKIISSDDKPIIWVAANEASQAEEEEEKGEEDGEVGGLGLAGWCAAPASYNSLLAPGNELSGCTNHRGPLAADDHLAQLQMVPNSPSSTPAPSSKPAAPLSGSR